jgi:hypothetical protein
MPAEGSGRISIIGALCPATHESVEFVPQQQRQTGSIQVPRLLFDAYTGHAGAVTALLRDSEAIGPSEETDGFVP